ncbi:hypothetical protein C5F52_01730 [Limnohabitans sp. TS-CS-82]|uniref:porin n=1 Tax=Limnohabitans sp. TS-CS-82 TaxID=2094193 RepID=UPI000CF2990F|nr:porin [Limnohabitans sp. TS-CS-82]PQA84749.1 hypothetical protein C5F52_01730 [Limnohabitans sp. TS-CS-82]
MKKTLVAIAALAAFGAQAQSSVSLTGNVDVGYRAISVGNNAQKDAKLITHNNASTSAIFFKAVEDLGGGTKANFFGEADFAPSKNALQNSSTTNNGFSYSGAFFNSEVYVGLNGALGDIKLGAPNSPALSAAGTSNPFGTALGGGYSDTFGRLGTNGNVGINGYSGQATTARIIRHERAVVYTTPTYSGFSGQYEVSFKNGNATGTTSSATTDGTTYASNNNGLASLSLKYNQGPLNAMYYSGTLTGPANQAAGTISSAGALTANGITANNKVKYNIAAANYTVGAVTGYVGFTTTKSDQTGTPSASITDKEDSKSSNYAVKYAATPTIDLLFNRVTRTSNQATDLVRLPNGKATLTGLGADYKLSKTSSVYYRYEKAANVVVTGSGASSNTYGDQKIQALGLRVAF